MDRSLDLTAKLQENAFEEPKVDINFELDNSEKAEDYSLNAHFMTYENAIFGKKVSNKA